MSTQDVFRRGFWWQTMGFTKTHFAGGLGNSGGAADLCYVVSRIDQMTLARIVTELQ